MNAVDYLFNEKYVSNQTDLANKIGITGAALSRIKNGTKTVSDETIRKMNDAFGCIFNLSYFRGEGELLASSEQQPTPPTAPDYQRELIESLKSRIEDKDREIAYLRSVIDRLHHRLGVSQQWDTTRASFMVSDELQPPAPDK